MNAELVFDEYYKTRNPKLVEKIFKEYKSYIIKILFREASRFNIILSESEKDDFFNDAFITIISIIDKYNFVCKICSDQFRSQVELMSHHAEQHGVVGAALHGWVCSECMIDGECRADVVAHVIANHTQKPKFSVKCYIMHKVRERFYVALRRFGTLEDRLKIMDPSIDGSHNHVLVEEVNAREYTTYELEFIKNTSVNYWPVVDAYIDITRLYPTVYTDFMYVACSETPKSVMLETVSKRTGLTEYQVVKQYRKFVDTFIELLL